MKNLVWAVTALGAIFVLIFFFAGKEKISKDTFIPSQSPVPTPELEFLKPKGQPGLKRKNFIINPHQFLNRKKLEAKRQELKRQKEKSLLSFLRTPQSLPPILYF